MGTVKRTEKKVHFKVIMFIASLLFRSKKSVPIDSVLSEKTKIVLVGFEDDRLMKNLDMRGYDNSLLLISGKKKMITAYQDGKKMFQYKSPSQIARNNADVIFLSTKASRHSWRFSHIQHASTIVIELKGLLSLVLVFTGFTLNRLFKRVTFKGFTNGYNEVNKKPMIVIDVLKRKEEQTRKYISPLIGIESFFEELNNHGIRYTILRWFEKLPLIEEGEDIDLLVDNGDAKDLTHLLNEHVGMIPCDTYTVTGINGFDYHSISYFTPTLASDLLNTSIRHKNVYKVPDKEKHFYSLVYHALYHKGYESGLPSTFFPTLYSNPEHDYNKIITELAKNASISVTISMESLHSLLESKGYSPPLDTLYRLSFKNEWIHRLLDKTQNNPIAGKNITVFVLREEAKRNELESRLIKEIENEGFTVLLKKELSEREKDIFSSHTRGGNWGKGPYKHIGGNPATIVVTTDLIPQSVDVYTSIKYPGLQNKRVTCKTRLRLLANKLIPAEKECNMIHSSDNDLEAWYYMNLIMSEMEKEQVMDTLNQVIEEFQTHEPVLKELSGYGRRAKVELIEYKGKKAVKKTFKPQCKRFYKRELEAMISLKGKINELPDMLDYGPNYIIYPYYKDRLKWKRGMFRFMSIKQSRHVIDFLEKLYNEGYAFVDFYPMNVLYDKKSGLKVIDYEFLYRYDIKPVDFKNSYDIAGIPKTFESDAPIQDDYGYNFNLLPYIGTDLDSLMNDSIFLLCRKRVQYFFTKKVRFSIQDKLIVSFRSLAFAIDSQSKWMQMLVRIADSQTLRSFLK